MVNEQPRIFAVHDTMLTEHSAVSLEYQAIDFEKIGSVMKESPQESSRFLLYSKSSLTRRKALSELEFDQLKREKEDLETFWLDVLDPTDSELAALGQAFHIHELTIEDIQTADTREKCDVFPNYYFIEVKSIRLREDLSVETVPVSILVFTNCILSVEEVH
jgi:Mg2+ and Co2+ transporter CorA